MTEFELKEIKRELVNAHDDYKERRISFDQIEEIFDKSFKLYNHIVETKDTNNYKK